jgi:hypothetical protein
MAELAALEAALTAEPRRTDYTLQLKRRDSLHEELLGLEALDPTLRAADISVVA